MKELQFEDMYQMRLLYPKGRIADTFGRTNAGGIDFGGLDNQILMIELKGGIRYVGLVVCGKDNEWILHTGSQVSTEENEKMVGGLKLDEYVFPLRDTKYNVVKNKDKESHFKYYLQTTERSCFDGLRRDSTLFEKMIPPGFSGLFSSS
jgi:hypothetical protein